MNYLIILNSDHDDHLVEISKCIENYDRSIVINKSTWLIKSKYNSKVIREQLMHVMGMKDALFIFKIGADYTASNALDVLNWIEDSQTLAERYLGE